MCLDSSGQARILGSLRSLNRHRAKEHPEERRKATGKRSKGNQSSSVSDGLPKAGAGFLRGISSESVSSSNFGLLTEAAELLTRLRSAALATSSESYWRELLRRTADASEWLLRLTTQPSSQPNPTELASLVIPSVAAATFLEQWAETSPADFTPIAAKTAISLKQIAVAAMNTLTRQAESPAAASCIQSADWSTRS